MNRRYLTCVTLAATLAASSLVTARQAAAPQTPPAAGRQGQGGRGGGPVKSPEVGADGRVTFRLRAPNAKEVARHAGRQAPADAEGRPGRLERDDRRDGAGHLHVLVHRRRRDDQRSVEPGVADIVGSAQSMFCGAWARSLAARARRAARRDHPSRLPFDRCQRRPRILCLHAARLRRAARAAVSGALSPARAGRRRRTVGERAAAPTTSSTI